MMMRALSFAFAVLLPVLCRAGIAMQLGVESNLLIDDNRVIFVQAGGSLTALHLETGEVLHRRAGDYYTVSMLKRVEPGILVLDYSKVALLDPQNLSEVWWTKSSYDPNVLEETLVSYDGNGLVEHRRLTDGTVLWSYNLPGGLEVVAEGNKVLVHRAAMFGEVAVLLDLETGEELFRKTPQPGTIWPDLYFDGKHVYAKEAFYLGEPYTAQVKNLSVWNTAGEEVRRVSLEAYDQEKLRWGWFDWEGKRFSGGRVHPIPEPWLGSPPGTTWVTDLQNGSTLLHRRDEIELQSPEGRWTGRLPYLPIRGEIWQAVLDGHNLLLGSNFGHVECIDITTGESQWLYVFPAILSSWSGGGSSMATALASFRQQKKNPPEFGFTLAGEAPRPTRVIFDPQPDLIFRLLPLYLAAAWGAASAAWLALLYLCFHPRARHEDLRGSILGLVLLALIGFYHFGNVSTGSSYALRLAILAALITGVVNAVRFSFREHRATGIVWLAAFTGGLILLVPVLLRA
jgi:outer membrane protein assembly factor BamB